MNAAAECSRFKDRLQSGGLDAALAVLNATVPHRYTALYRLDGHPAQGVLVAYHGVPVHNHEGWLLGTLCHFDTVARPFSEMDCKFLLDAARVLPPYLPV